MTNHDATLEMSWQDTIDALQKKHTTPDGYDGEHPYWTKAEWAHEVDCGDTIRGYWEWAAAKIESEGNFDADGCAASEPSIG